MTLFTTGDGNTPLSPEEQDELIPSLSTREELNEWERQNIIAAHAWAFSRRGFIRRDLLTEDYVRELHRRMFDQTWGWAGTYRSMEKNLGIPHYRIREELANLLADARVWIEHTTYSPDEIAIRLHHRLVLIHPFANGNGRHARLMADLLVQKLGRPVFSWGSADIMSVGALRRAYIDALQSADRHEIQPLLLFARS
jgi:Fic-DOC domain mobile mystery protein B